MSGYGGWDTTGPYGTPSGPGANPNEFTMQFTDQSQQFESFNYDNTANPVGMAASTPQQPSYYNPSPQPTYFVPSPMAPVGGSTDFDGGPNGPTGFEDEPPLLEELGINPYQIIEKTRSVLNPFRHTDATILQDTDLAGPFVFCILFGFILLLSGKIHFGYIYGIGVLGCIGMYFLLNMMSMAGVSLGVTISVLGYCLLPMVGLAGLNLLLSLQDTLGLSLTIVSVVWCSYSASKLFVVGLGMQKQQPLVAYPCALVYGVFALLAVF